MVKFKQAFLGVVVAGTVALLPVAPAMANGHGYRGGHGFGVGRGLVGAAVALATLPLVIASNVVEGVREAVAPYPAQGYAAPAYGYAPPYSVPYYRYYAAPRVGYGPRPYYGGRPGYDGRGYYRAGGHSYPRR